jgi:hypothetical protein
VPETKGFGELPQGVDAENVRKLEVGFPKKCWAFFSKHLDKS